MTRQGQGVCRGKRRNKPPVTASRAGRLGPKSRDRRAKWQMPQVEGTKINPKVDSIWNRQTQLPRNERSPNDRFLRLIPLSGELRFQLPYRITQIVFQIRHHSLKQGRYTVVRMTTKLKNFRSVLSNLAQIKKIGLISLKIFFGHKTWSFLQYFWQGLKNHGLS